jgi:hypothetical protein
MPLITGFDTKVRHVTNTPVGAADLNTEITTQNGNGYACGAIVFTDDNNALLFFTRAGDAPLDQVFPQKVNQVAATQVALDADKATEAGNDYYPTAVFTTPAGLLFVMYSDFGDGS